jgi:hypothetical protein
VSATDSSVRRAARSYTGAKSPKRVVAPIAPVTGEAAELLTLIRTLDPVAM